MAEKRRMEIYGIVKRDRSRDFWTRIGGAFENKDGSRNLMFDFFPMDPTITVQMRQPKGDPGPQ